MIKKRNNLLVLSLLAITVSGCVTQPKDLSTELDNSDYLDGVESTIYSGEVFNSGEEAIKRDTKEDLYPGTGEFINYDAATRSRPTVSEQGAVTFNFEGESLPAVVHLIVGEVL